MLDILVSAVLAEEDFLLETAQHLKLSFSINLKHL